MEGSIRIMKRIILHWTAGKHFPTTYEKQFYHFLIDKNGIIHNGKYSPEDNNNCKDGKYAAHTGGGNTGSIGVAMCSMENFNTQKKYSNYPITPKQFESCMEFCAKLCKKYNIEITPQTVMTHYEFGNNHTKTSSFGKIDIIYLPTHPYIAKQDIGNFIRTKIRWYKNKI